MKNIVLYIVISISSPLAFAGGYELIEARDFKHYGDTPLSHTIYMGSDSSYHYFTWSYGKSGGKWKIKKMDLPLTCELRFGEKMSESVIMKNSAGKYEPWKCRNT